MYIYLYTYYSILIMYIIQVEGHIYKQLTAGYTQAKEYSQLCILVM